MAVTLAQFIAQLAETGILSPADIQAFQDSLPPEKLTADDAQDFARELVRRRKLTSYQASAVYKNNGRSLLIGHYIVIEKLGQGGMGTVYKAEFRRMKRTVALKMMSGAALKAPDAAARFLREVEAAARLTHPNIVAALDAGEARGLHYLVMEYVEGTDLAAYVKKRGPLPVDQAVHYIMQAARGLAHAHQAGVIHRDIKPANLLLDKSGTVKILDMGLARLDNADGEQAQLTHTGAIMGTVDYMPPEQALNTKSATAKADMYSLGITLWYLLTGEAAYGGETLMAKLLAHREQPIPLLTSRRDDVSAALDAVFRRMAAKRPEDRFASMEEVITHLGACLAGGIAADVTFSSTQSSLPPADVATNRGSPDWDVQDFLQAIAPAATARAGLDSPGNADDTLSSRSSGSTRHSPGTAASPSAIQKLLNLPRWLMTGSLAAVLLVGLGIWMTSAKQPKPSNSGETVRKQKPKSGEAETTADEPAAGPNQKPGWQGWPADAPAPAVAPFSVRDAKKHQVAWGRYLKIPVEQTNGMGMEFHLIPPGEFKMGLTEKQDQSLRRLVSQENKAWFDSAKPQHAVRLTQPFAMGVHEIRYGEFVDLMQRMPGNLPREDWMTDAAPVMRGASWYDAVEFCNALSAREGLSPCYRVDGDDVELIADGTGYRLPTEAEWEFACRAGTETVWFYGLDPQDHLQNPKAGMRTHFEYARDANSLSGEIYSQSNPFGLLGLYAGADEWCWDGFAPYATTVLSPGKSLENPTGPGFPALRVKRGGASWSNGGGDLSSINSVTRAREDPKATGPWTGLGRVVLNVPPQRREQPAESRATSVPAK